MKNKIIAALSIALALIFTGQGLVQASTTQLQFVQTPTDALYNSISASVTTMIITPYPVDLDGNKLTMNDFGLNPTLTIDPKVSGIEEIIGFTGIVDNGNNTATLTGLTRDLTSKAPYTSAGTGKQHGAGAVVVFSNNPQMYARLASLENIETITGLWTYSTSPIVPTPTTPTQVANKAYVDAVALAGCSNASTILQGCVQIPTALQMASSTASGSTGALLVVPTSLSTSTPGYAGLWNVVSLNDGKLSPNWLNGTGETYTLSGGLLSTATTTFTATTTIAASSLNKALVLNTLPYYLPPIRAASSTVLSENGSGSLSWEPVVANHYSWNLASAVGLPGATQHANQATSTFVIIPANVMAASSTLVIDLTINTVINSGAGSATYYITNDADPTGTPLISFTGSSVSAKENEHLVLINQSSTGVQKWSLFETGTTGSITSSSINTTNGLTLDLISTVAIPSSGNITAQYVVGSALLNP